MVPSTKAFCFTPRDSATFASEDHRHIWLVEQILVGNQPCLIGGPNKSLKTSVMLDLALSLCSGAPFLNKFPVPEPVRVAVVSGENRIATVQETAHRICQEKDIYLDDCDVFWQTDLPCLSSAEDRDQLQRGLEAAKVKVVFIDPLYLCLLGGQETISTSNLYEVGPLLLKATRACLDVGATPVFVHHATKTAVRKADGGPLELDDLAFAGIGEFARQWLLLNRRIPYQIGNGRHTLNMVVGGSFGHSNLWRVDVDERKAGTERQWRVMVISPEEDYPLMPIPPKAPYRSARKGKSLVGNNGICQ